MCTIARMSDALVLPAKDRNYHPENFGSSTYLDSILVRASMSECRDPYCILGLRILNSKFQRSTCVNTPGCVLEENKAIYLTAKHI
ncbi:hypothetical protein K439DRAFT_1630935 [Ramaria rubella]|nr:hypothetical protein K439DRAFT_1630935 [Ramaria rubella]